MNTLRPFGLRSSLLAFVISLLMFCAPLVAHAGVAAVEAEAQLPEAPRSHAQRVETRVVQIDASEIERLSGRQATAQELAQFAAGEPVIIIGIGTTTLLVILLVVVLILLLAD